jgi:hypothetical protein
MLSYLTLLCGLAESVSSVRLKDLEVLAVDEEGEF